MILYSGTLEPYQGTPLLLASMADVAQTHPDAVLVVMGGREDQVNELQEQVDALGLRRHRPADRHRSLPLGPGLPHGSRCAGVPPRTRTQHSAENLLVPAFGSSHCGDRHRQPHPGARRVVQRSRPSVGTGPRARHPIIAWTKAQLATRRPKALWPSRPTTASSAMSAKSHGRTPMWVGTKPMLRPSPRRRSHPRHRGTRADGSTQSAFTRPLDRTDGGRNGDSACRSGEAWNQRTHAAASDKQREGGIVNVVVTGAAGFIGSHLSEALCAAGHRVLGLDCITDYYDPERKETKPPRARLTPRISFRRDRSAKR